MNTKEIGNFGEDKACEFLEKQGIKVLKRNFYARCGEIDIIAKDGETIVFAEVKTRTNNRYGNPENAVNYWKRKHMELTARNYIDHKRKGNFIARFDVVEVFAKYADNNFIVEKFNLIKNVL